MGGAAGVDVHGMPDCFAHACAICQMDDAGCAERMDVGVHASGLHALTILHSQKCSDHVHVRCGMWPAP